MTDSPRVSSGGSLSLAAALASITPIGAISTTLRIDPAAIEDLLPAEAAALPNAVTRRQAEFATGRAALHRLLGPQFDHVPITIGPDRAPVLPHGVTASLAHDATDAVAIMTPHRTHRTHGALGIDIEPIGAVEPVLAERIVRADDSVVAAVDDGLLDPTVAFVVKEATFKAWSRSGGTGLLEFSDVHLTAGTGTSGDPYLARVVRDDSTWAIVVADGDGRFVAVSSPSRT